MTIILLITAALLYLATRSLSQALAQARRNEQTLRESEERFRSVVENAPIGIFIIDNAFRFIYTNDELCRLVGRDRDEVIGLDFRELLDEASRRLTAERYMRRQRGETVPVRYDSAVVRKDGEKRQIELCGATIKNSAGEVQTVGQALDITERVRAQEESARLQAQVIEAQRAAMRELSTPVIPVGSQVIAMPLIGAIDAARAQDILRALLAGVTEHRARVAIVDITGVPLIDSEVAGYLDKAIQAARLKGTETIITGISDAVAETLVDLGIDWNKLKTLRDLQSGLRAAMDSFG